jgi:Right handed beta helix region
MRHLLLALLLCPTLALAQPTWDPEAVGARTPYGRALALDLADYCDGTDTADDTDCIRTWVADAKTRKRHLYASAGTYHYTKGVDLYGGVQLQCATPLRTVFKALGDAHDFLLLHAERTPQDDTWHDMRVENCGFDLNGTQANFASVIAFVGGTQPVQHLTVRGNLVWDSTQPGQMYTDANRQRQYITILHATDVLVEHNHLAEGGRIKVGRPGSRIVIRHNTLHNINDNGITVVDQGSGFSGHLLIAANTLTNPLGSGVFFGSDGQNSGAAALTLQDVTVRGNGVRGNWKTNCLTGVLPNHTSEILVEDNTCFKTGSTATGTFPGGVGLSRNNTTTQPATDVTVRENVIGSAVPNALNNAAGIFITDLFSNLCLLGNTIRDTATAVRLRSGMPVVTFVGNDLGGGTVRLGAGIVLDQVSGEEGCYGTAAEEVP